MNKELQEFPEKFLNDVECLQYLSRARWPNGVLCLNCSSPKNYWVPSRKVYWCGDCHKQFSVLRGTIFEKSHISLNKWFQAIWLTVTHRGNIPSTQLSKEIGVTQKTAWKMLKKIGDIMVFEDRFGDLLNRVSNNNMTAHDLIKIILGDSREVLQQLPDSSVHMVLTDPPYFLDGLDGDWDKGRDISKRGTGAVGGLPVGMKFDVRQGIEFQNFMQPIAKELFRILKPGGFFVSFSQPRLFHRLAIAVENEGFEIRDMIVWHFTKQAQFKAFTMNHFIKKMDNLTEQEKSSLIKSLSGRRTPQLRPQFEAMMLAMKPKEGTFVENWMKYKVGLIDSKITQDGRAPSTLMKFEKPVKEKYNSHLTVKPVPLLMDLIRIFTSKNQIVIDPFLGSGSTAIAALKTNRRCIGIEIVPEYTEIAKRRIKEVTK